MEKSNLPLLVGRGHLATILAKEMGIPDDLRFLGDLADFPAYYEKASKSSFFPKSIVNTAGKTELEWCERSPLDAWNVNVNLTVKAFRSTLMVSGLQRPPLWIQLSSGCVWDGPFPPMGLSFKPDEPVTPASFYSWTKAACDALMLKESRDAKSPLALLRPRQVYSDLPSPRNILTKLLKYPALIRIANSMTSAYTISKTVSRLLGCHGHCIEGRIINVYDSGITTPFDVGVLLHEAGLREMPKPMKREDLTSNFRPKRVDVVMEDPWFEDMVQPPSIEDEMRRVIGLLAKSMKTTS